MYRAKPNPAPPLSNVKTCPTPAAVIGSEVNSVSKFASKTERKAPLRRSGQQPSARLTNSTESRLYTFCRSTCQNTGPTLSLCEIELGLASLPLLVGNPG